MHGVRRARGQSVHAQAEHRRAERPRRRVDRGRRERDASRACARRAAGVRAGRCASAPTSLNCVISRPRGCIARRCHARSSRAPRQRPASMAPSSSPGAARSSCAAGRAWSVTTGAPSTPSDGSGCTVLAFVDAPGAWLDVALGRVRLAGRMTPWVANGALFVDGALPPPRRSGCARPARRAEPRAGASSSCAAPAASSSGRRRASRRLRSRLALRRSRRRATRNGQHDVVNCSVAALELTLSGGPRRRSARFSRTEHGGAYELGTPTLKRKSSANHGVLSERSTGRAVLPAPDPGLKQTGPARGRPARSCGGSARRQTAAPQGGEKRQVGHIAAIRGPAT